MKVAVYNQKVDKIADLELNPKVFEVKSSEHLLTEAVRILLSNARKGLAHTKTRGEVRGGGKKPWKQKGTGRARAGSTRSPIWRHGGVTFGPRSNRNWELKMNKQAKTKALFMSLSDKAKNQKIFVFDTIGFEKPKTKDFVDFIKTAKNSLDMGKKQILVMPKSDKNLIKSVRNLQQVTSVLASNLNIVDILKADSLLVLKDSFPVIEKTFLRN